MQGRQGTHGFGLPPDHPLLHVLGGQLLLQSCPLVPQHTLMRAHTLTLMHSHTHTMHAHSNTLTHTHAHTHSLNQSPRQARQASYTPLDAIAFSFPSSHRLPLGLTVLHLAWPIGLLTASLQSTLRPAAGGNFIKHKSHLRGEGEGEELRSWNPTALEQAQLPREALGDPATLAVATHPRYNNL